MVGVALREHGCLQFFRRAAVGPVVVALTLLVLDDLPLVVEGFLAQGVEEGAHAVGLQPQDEFQMVAGDGLEVVGAVDPGGAVERPAGAGDEAEVLGFADVTGALEHHVLEEVGQPGLAGDLVAGADVVPDVDGCDGGERIGGHDEAQPVAELLVGETDRGRRGCLRCRGWRGRLPVACRHGGLRVSPGSSGRSQARSSERSHCMA